MVMMMMTTTVKKTMENDQCSKGAHKKVSWTHTLYFIGVTCQIALYLPLSYFPCSIVSLFCFLDIIFCRRRRRHYDFASIQFTVVPPYFVCFMLMNAFFHDFWSQRHRRVMKTTNVPHKILKFNKFSSTNFNLVSCLPFFHCDSLINRSYVHFFVLKIQFSWPHGRDYKITCGLHSLHISAREIELRECRAAKKLFEKVPTKYWSEFRLPLFGV